MKKWHGTFGPIALDLAVGQIWVDVTWPLGTEVKITAITEIVDPNRTWPWPMVHYKTMDLGMESSTGAPAFLAGHLVHKSDG